MAVTSTRNAQKNVVVNPAMGMVFFESQALAFNYKTGQWTRLPHASGKRFFPVYGTDRVLGTIEEGPTAGEVMMQDSSLSGTSARTGTVVSGDIEIEAGYKTTVNGLQPIADATASAATVRLGSRDLFTDSVTYVTGSAANSRTGMHHFRGNGNPTGRYQRAEIVYPSGFNSVSGAYVEFFKAGRT